MIRFQVASERAQAKKKSDRHARQFGGGPLVTDNLRQRVVSRTNKKIRLR